MVHLPTRRSLLAGAAGASALPLLGSGARAQGTPLGIGFIYVGPTGDYGWTHAHDLGRKAIEKEFGPKVKYRLG